MTKETLFDRVYEHYKLTRPRKFKQPKEIRISKVLNMPGYESKEFKRQIARLSKKDESEKDYGIQY